MLSGLLVIPSVFCPCQSCLVLPCPDVYIKDYNLSLRPRLRVPVSPSCVHRDNDYKAVQSKCFLRTCGFSCSYNFYEYENFGESWFVLKIIRTHISRTN